MAFANLRRCSSSGPRALASRPRYRVPRRRRLARGHVGGDGASASSTIAAGAPRARASRPGTGSALLSATRPEWMEIDLAILACGALTVPIYPSNLAAECGYIVANSGVVGRLRREREAAREDRRGARDGLRARRRPPAGAACAASSRSTARDGRGRRSRALIERGRARRRGSAGGDRAAHRRRSARDDARDHRLHLGDDRAAEGRPADARQPPRHGRVARCALGHRARGRRRLLLPAARALLRAPDRVLRHRGRHDRRRSRAASTRWPRTSRRRARTSCRRCRASTRRSTGASRRRARPAARSSARSSTGRSASAASAAAATQAGEPVPLCARSSQDAVAHRLVFARIHAAARRQRALHDLGRRAAGARDRRVLPRRRHA